MKITWYPPQIPFINSSDTFSVRRIYCIGRNYRAHALEMGDDTHEPFYFCKTSDCVTVCSEPITIPFPIGTSELHHEVELVAAIGRSGVHLTPDQAATMVVGYAVGIDFTRRDRQAEAKAKRRPWTSGKNFAHAAIVSPLNESDNITEYAQGPIQLTVNGEIRQAADLSQMIWSLQEIVQRLSELNFLEPGDLIFTGTPAGVSPLVTGDRIQATICDLPSLHIEIGATKAL